MSGDVGWKAVGTVLLGRWPGQVAAWGREGIAAFISEVQADGIEPAEAIAALRAHASDYPPSASTVSRLAERAVQGPAPTYEIAQREIAGRLSMLPSAASKESAKTAWPAFVARLGEKHEAIARFAVSLGPKGVRELPDPRAAHGAQVDSARRSLTRSVADWDADPRRGIAAAEAARELDGAAAAGALAADMRPQLEEGER